MSKSSDFYAHTPPDDDPTRWQTMREHAENVATLAAQFAAVFGAQELARWCGWLHDVGKYSDEFQSYLRACHDAKTKGGKAPKVGTAEHKCAGAKLAISLLQPHSKSIVASSVLGHHGGLNAASSIKNYIQQAEEKQNLEKAIERAQQDLPFINTTPPGPISLPADEQEARLHLEWLIRFVFSCLVDADSLDTEAHFSKDRAKLRGSPSRTLKSIAKQWLETLKSNQEMLQAKSPDLCVNKVRREVYEACLNAAPLPQGVFSLTVPTSGGKTRSSLAFALAHAIEHGHTRIIYAVPYTSIIDQTVNVFREILGEDAVLEHHSAIETRVNQEEDPEVAQAEDAREQQRRLASENWNAPLIVTTTVQLFESLFSNRTSRCRKLHNVAGSIIILDEVQTLPLHLLAPILDGLRTLVAYYSVTVVLCTATQPAFTGETPYLKGFPRVTPIISNPKPHFEALRRVTYRIVSEAWDWRRIADEMQSRNSSCLAVLNTKRDALALLKECEGANVHHLSTLLCGAHRKDVLAEVQAALEAERKQEGPPLLLVSTQVVEAGVDLDFPYVFRAKGPLDRIIQAAGRCNREGRRDRQASEVVIFDPKEGSAPPGEYRTGLDLAWSLITQSKGSFDFDSPEVATAYFDDLFNVVGKSQLGEDVQQLRKIGDFPEVAKRVRLIREDTVSVLVPYYRPIHPNAYLDEERFKMLVETIRTKGMSRERWRQVQPLTVAIATSEANRNQDVLETLLPDELYLWCGKYDGLTGIGEMIACDPSDLFT